ncbi:MAG: CYTH domain-containing protein, partial [Pseudomonadota bacterium]
MGREAAGAARREIELKLVLDPPTLARIRKAGALSRLPVVSGSGRSTVHNLTSLYWDTEHHALARAGMALRVRRDGGRVVQALKAADSDGRSGGLVADRAEDEAMRPAADAFAPPDLSLVADEQLRVRAAAAIGDDELIPIFESAISRVARVLNTSGKGSFEAALDLGEVRLP